MDANNAAQSFINTMFLNNDSLLDYVLFYLKCLVGQHQQLFVAATITTRKSQQKSPTVFQLGSKPIPQRGKTTGMPAS